MKIRRIVNDSESEFTFTLFDPESGGEIPVAPTESMTVDDVEMTAFRESGRYFRMTWNDKDVWVIYGARGDDGKLYLAYHHGDKPVCEYRIGASEAGTYDVSAYGADMKFTPAA